MPDSRRSGILIFDLSALVNILDHCGRVCLVALLQRHASHAARVGSVKKAMDRFALSDVDAGGLFVIQVLIERRSAQFYPCLNIESAHFKRELGTVELNYASTLGEI